MKVGRCLPLGIVIFALPLLAADLPPATNAAGGTPALRALPPATVSFLDGSFLRGELVSVRGDALVWRHPNARHPLEFSTTNLNTVQLASRAPKLATNGTPPCRLRLVGGDEVEGQLVSLDGEWFELETWFAGRLRGQRAGLVSLAFLHADQPTYEGPQAADEWHISAGGGNRAAVDVLGGGNLFVRARPLEPAVPRFQVVEPGPLPAAKPALTAPELVAQIKAELASLGEKVTPVVREALNRRLKEVEELVARQPGKAAEPNLVPAVPPRPPRPLAMPFVVPAAPAAAPVLAQPASPSWLFRDGAFYSLSTGTLGRECNLPTKARVEFDLAWKGQPYFRFQFYTRSVEQFDFSDGWQFYSSGSGVLYPMRRGGGALNPARVPQMVNKTSVRLTFLLDTEKESVLVLADGEKVQEWRALGRPGNGTGIVFYNFNANSRLRLSNLRIAPWDGIFGEAIGEATRETDAKEAAVQFVNQDRATGTVQEIRNGRLILQTEAARLEIPLTRVAAIVLPALRARSAAVSAAAGGVALLRAGDSVAFGAAAGGTPALRAMVATTNTAAVQLLLHRNERLTLALERWEADEVIAVSPIFGQLRLSPTAVRALRFNPTTPRTATDEWSGSADNLFPRP